MLFHFIPVQTPPACTYLICNPVRPRAIPISHGRQSTISAFHGTVAAFAATFFGKTAISIAANPLKANYTHSVCIGGWKKLFAREAKP